MKLYRNLCIGLLAGIIVALVVGCKNPSTTAFRLQQTSENLAFTAFTGWTNYLSTHQVDPALSNSVKEVRLKFAATDTLIDHLRVAYTTNSAVGSQLNAAVATLADQSSNLVWTVNYLLSR